MFVVLDCSLHRILTETQRCFQFEDKLRVALSLLVVVVEILSFRLVEFVPGVFSESVNVYSLLRVGYEDLLQDVLRIRRQEFWQGVIRIQNFLVQVRCLLVLEWKEAAEHCVEHNAATPYI